MDLLAFKSEDNTSNYLTGLLCQINVLIWLKCFKNAHFEVSNT